MWLRSEQRERRCRRLGSRVVAVASRGGIKKQIATLASPRLASQGTGRLSRCGRVSRWRRRSGNLLKEVTLIVIFHLYEFWADICASYICAVCSLLFIKNYAIFFLMYQSYSFVCIWNFIWIYKLWRMKLLLRLYFHSLACKSVCHSL